VESESFKGSTSLLISGIPDFLLRSQVNWNLAALPLTRNDSDWWMLSWSMMKITEVDLNRLVDMIA